VGKTLNRYLFNHSCLSIVLGFDEYNSSSAIVKIAYKLFLFFSVKQEGAIISLWRAIVEIYQLIGWRYFSSIKSTNIIIKKLFYLKPVPLLRIKEMNWINGRNTKSLEIFNTC